MTQTILVTGGAGYIGSHTCVELLAAGHRVIVVDNLDNSCEESLRRVTRITGKRPEFHRIDLLDRPALDAVFARESIDAVIHFAGLKAVGESVAKPLRYYHNNVTGTLHLLEIMSARGVRKLVFSSSATVYGDPQRVPITEDLPLSATNPYGQTKLFIEEICRDLAKAESDWSIVLLRYFNPIGAHASGSIGEDPKGVPNNLMPYIMQVAVGKRPHLNIWGKDYPTPDGTGVRDYIHVVDLALGHLAALAALPRLPGCTAINLGTGRGYSVLDLVKAASKAVGKGIPYQFADRRPGDVATCYADPDLADRLLGWRARLGLDAMCADHWRWQSGNPDGYGST
ncbi:MAG: UDP-glucose 4-epimerase GalE [Planctomycetes bacterium]|nr:UDP-glucose 4-epimerase GalE [Planctomycetota bacterium]